MLDNAEEARIQRSFRDEGRTPYGTLYIVGTPIGNLDDMTYRAVHILKEATWIAAEDTRQSRKLLTHFDIPGKLVSYHEHNKGKSGEALLDKLLAGETVALVSDAGMPAISDPGADLVAEAIERGVSVVPIPGPNAALTALVASGLPTDAFTFVGFLPRDKRKASETLARWKRQPATLLFYEAPHRVEATLKLMLEAWGDRRCVLARELTKRYEEFARGTISSCLKHVEANGPMGEYCVLVEGDSGIAGDGEDEIAWWAELTPAEHVEAYERKEGLPHKEALKKAAIDRNVPKRELYNAIHQGKPE
ncbi:16S rRNA (cytidine(1402)-2'-O)-methyltransferase [Paenibacillus antri]|uniref:Ribosomal RNA small subunit methyltransferase I n=1 Tax=Paenibacillus antri TaxID=2582848 RepID=A0A5R9G2S0_9BACL|nr:16S rRNA (cytidine(1402)-2'-O)-methyltransferase [Paenibacillus antri]TLS48586.1 16S rRNA (cytidine(1402)-2'-O)-methyltransferase [Paenibacillus antri]